MDKSAIKLAIAEMGELLTVTIKDIPPQYSHLGLAIETQHKRLAAHLEDFGVGEKVDHLSTEYEILNSLIDCLIPANVAGIASITKLNISLAAEIYKMPVSA